MAQARREERELLAVEVVEEIPGKHEVVLRALGRGEELHEELRVEAGALGRCRLRGVEVLDVQLAAVLRQTLDVAADRRAQIEDVQPVAPSERREDDRQGERAVDLRVGLDLRRRPFPRGALLLARTGAAQR